MKKKGNEKDKLLEALAGYGLGVAEAEELVEGIDNFKGAKAPPGKRHDGEKPFDPGEFPDELKKLLDQQGDKDLVEFLVNATDERLIDTSEVPSSMLMDIVAALSEDEICSDGSNTESPVWIIMRNLLKCMIARDRKRVKEVIELYQSGQEKKALEAGQGFEI